MLGPLSACGRQAGSPRLTVEQIDSARPGNPLFIVSIGDRWVSRSLREFKGLRRRLDANFPQQMPAVRDGFGVPEQPNAGPFALQHWLQRIMNVDILSDSTEFKLFLTDDISGSSDEDDDGTAGSSDHKELDEILEVQYDVCLNPISVDDFLLIRVIGRGSFGKVMLVRHKTSDRIFALKQIDKRSIMDRGQSDHTRTERNVLEYLRHPFIVRMRSAFQNDRKLFLVLDYCAGGELFFHLSREGKFSEDRCRFYMAQVCLAIEYLHDLGVVFRDLKLENVLLDAEGHIALTDFGLAKEDILDNDSAHSFCGTLEYLAPEVLNRTGHGRAADWWAFGTMLFEMLTGMPPFFSKNQKSLVDKILNGRLNMPRCISPPAADLLRRLLNRSIDERLGSKDDGREIKSHCFFAGIDWGKMLAKRIPPPFRPCRDKTAEDTSNFEPQFTNMPLGSLDAIRNKGRDDVHNFEMFSFTAVDNGF